jgi:hypothetical protein
MSFTKPLPFRGSSLLELTYAFFLFSQSDLVPIVGPTVSFL